MYNKPLFRHPCRLIIAGRSQKGKTTLLIKLLIKYFMHQVDRIIIISPTYYHDVKWRLIDCNLTKEDRIYTEYYPKVIIQLSNYVKTLSMMGLATLVVMDDLTYAARTQGKSERLLNRLIADAVHFNTSVVVSVQRMVHTTMDMRENTDYFITFSNVNQGELSTIYKYFGGGTKKQFYELLHRATSRSYDTLCVDMSGPQIVYRCNLVPIRVGFLATHDAKNLQSSSKKRKYVSSHNYDLPVFTKRRRYR